MPLSAERCDALLNCDFASGLFDYQIDSYLVAREWRLEHILNDPSSYMHAHNMGPPRSDEEGVMIYPRVLDRSRWVCERDYAVFRDGVPKRVKKGVLEMFEDMIYYHYNKVLRPELIKPEYEEWEKTTTSKEWEVLKRQHGRWGRSKWYKVRDCSVQVRVAGGGREEVGMSEDEFLSYIMAMRRDNRLHARWQVHVKPASRASASLPYVLAFTVEVDSTRRGLSLVSVIVLPLDF